jgi:hypothetical protein
MTKGGLPAMPARLELDALIAQRNELDAQHTTAVELLEAQGPDRSIVNRRECTRIYDERAGVQKRIDEFLARERAR